jgi:hypothetical protein
MFVDAFIGVLFALIVLSAVGKFGGNHTDAGESEPSDRHSL